MRVLCGNNALIMETCLIHSIFKATEGEGVFVGTPQVFVRFQGCSIGCVNCDSMETWSFKEGRQLSVLEVYSEVEKAAEGLKRVTITGGDPLHPKHTPAVLALCQKFSEKGFFINIEASGTRFCSDVFDAASYVSFDYKTPSTGVKTSLELVEKLIQEYPESYQIKSVVANDRDFEYILVALKSLTEKGYQPPNWVITPCFNFDSEFDPALTQRIYELNYEAGGPFRVIGQQHKWVYGSDSLTV